MNFKWCWGSAPRRDVTGCCCTCAQYISNSSLLYGQSAASAALLTAKCHRVHSHQLAHAIICSVTVPLEEFSLFSLLLFLPFTAHKPMMTDLSNSLQPPAAFWRGGLKQSSLIPFRVFSLLFSQPQNGTARWGKRKKRNKQDELVHFVP